MNEVAQKAAQQIAMQAVAEKYASGDPAVYAALDGPEKFAADVAAIKEKILAVAVDYFATHGLPGDAKPAKAQRKPRNEAKATASAKVSPEEMKDFLSKRQAPTSLAVLAELLGCSKGVAQRALMKLGDAVRCEEGESNGPGKPPMLYSLAS